MTPDAMPAGEVCIANIGLGQRRSRQRLGVALLGGGAALALAVWALGLSSLWLAPMAALFFAGFTGVIQAREKT